MSAVWPGLLLIFFSDGGCEDDLAMNLSTRKKKKVLPPKHHGHSCFSLDQLAEEVLLFIAKSQLSGGRARGLFPSDSCSAFIVMILLGLRMLSSQGPLQTGAQIRTTVTFFGF